MESKLEQAMRHVLRGEQIVAAQSEIVERLKANGLDTTGAVQLLDQFKNSLAIFRADLEAIKAKGDSD